MDNTLATITAEVQRPTTHVANVLKLLEDGATIPFIARYRKELTGSMDEDVLRTIQQRSADLAELAERKAAVLKSIEEQGHLTPELRQSIEAAATVQRVEDLYLPYRPKRRTRAMIAREKGLEPLAVLLQSQAATSQSLADMAAPYVTAELSTEEALAGAGDIVAETLSTHAEVRAWLRDHVLRHGVYTASATKEWRDKKSKFEAYYDYRKAVREIAAHALLALRRGEQEDVLTVRLEVEPDPPVAYLAARLIRRNGPPYAEFLAGVAADAWQRLLKPSITGEVDTTRKAWADDDAIRTFAVNLRHLLLSSPAGEKVVLGLDPGFRTGCKVAVVDRTGRFLDNTTIWPTEPRNDEVGATRTLLGLIEKHGVQLVAIGNGTAGRETDAFVGRALAALAPEKRPIRVTVSEAGASVYSASPLAKAEFPDLDVTVRGAISIARRLQDPLAELVKIEPKSIGVGQYQHDVDQKALAHSLEGVVESCVNHVGVDLNTASGALLQFVSGLSATQAKNIVALRSQRGGFKSRSELLEVSRFGPKAFEQAAGFLRIRDGIHPLDNSAVHPERYALVEQVARDVGVTVPELVGHAAVVGRVDWPRYVTTDVGLETLNDIRDELLKPGRDPRREFRYADFNADLKELKDLKPDLILEGVVTNVTAFGAFVDVGVHQDGLVHRSELAWRFVQDPAEVVKVGDVVKVKVLKVDLELKRISLSMKQTQAPPAPGGPRPQPARQPVPQRPAPPVRETPVVRKDEGPAGGRQGENQGTFRDRLKAWEQTHRDR